MGDIDFALCYFVLYQNQMLYRRQSILRQQSCFFQQSFDIMKIIASSFGMIQFYKNNIEGFINF